MDVQVESPGGLVRELRVSIPAEQVSKAVQSRLQQLAGRVRIAGFRPGKAPMKVVEQKYGDSARLEVINDLVSGSYPEAIGKSGLQPAGTPAFEVRKEQAGEPLQYTARFEIYPEIKLKGLDGFKIEEPTVAVGAEDVARVIESMRRAARELVEQTRAAKDGDVCMVDFEGTVDGAPFSGGKGADVEMEIGRAQFLPDLEQGLVGHKAGEAFEVPVTFPADYREASLQGKQAVFAVTLKAVKEPKLPEVDDAFLKSNGSDPAEGIAGLQAKVQAALETERDKAIRKHLKQQVMDQLLEANPVEVPLSMVGQELGRLRDEAAARFNAAKLKDEQKRQLFPDSMLEPAAKRRVSLGLLIGEVIREKSLAVDPLRVDKVLDEIASEYQQSEQVKSHYRSQPQLMQGLEAMVMEEQVVEALLAAVTKTPKAMGLDALMELNKN